jgi:integrase
MEILNVREVQKLFPKNYKTVWGDKEISFIANRLVSLTGMRIGEVLGLRGEFVFANYILVCGQYGEFGYKP